MVGWWVTRGKRGEFEFKGQRHTHAWDNPGRHNAMTIDEDDCG